MSKAIYLSEWLSKLHKRGYFKSFEIREPSKSISDDTQKTIVKFCYLIINSTLTDKLLNEIINVYVNIETKSELSNDFISLIDFSIGDHYRKNSVGIYIELTDTFDLKTFLNKMFPEKEIDLQQHVELLYKHLAKTIRHSYNLSKLGINNIKFSIKLPSINSNFAKIISNFELQKLKYNFFTFGVEIQNPYLPEFFIPMEYVVKLYQKLNLHAQCLTDKEFWVELTMLRNYKRKNAKENFIDYYNDYIIERHLSFEKFRNLLRLEASKQSTNEKEFFESLINDGALINEVNIVWENLYINFVNLKESLASVLNFANPLICASYQFKDVFFDFAKIFFKSSYTSTKNLPNVNWALNKLLLSYRNLTKFCK